MSMTVSIIIILVSFLLTLLTWFIIKESRNKELTLHVFDLIINILSLFTIIIVILGLSIDNSYLDLTLAKARGRAKEYKISAYLYSNIYAMPKVRSIYSPDNFDEIVKDDSLRYIWIEDKWLECEFYLNCIA